jgi:hypothetical protein
MANQSPGDTPAIDGDGDIIPETSWLLTQSRRRPVVHSVSNKTGNANAPTGQIKALLINYYVGVVFLAGEGNKSKSLVSKPTPHRRRRRPLHRLSRLRPPPPYEPDQGLFQQVDLGRRRRSNIMSRAAAVPSDK